MGAWKTRNNRTCKNGNKQKGHQDIWRGKIENVFGNNFWWSAKRIRMCQVVREPEKVENCCYRVGL